MTPLSVCIAGATLDTGNLGVNALCRSTISALHERVPEVEICVFDFGSGVRRRTLRGSAGDIEVKLCGCYHTRRIHRKESLILNGLLQRVPLFRTPALDALEGSAAVLDVSAGDSFSDIYGLRRFRSVVAMKKLVLRAGRPLILMPQTYGPFAHPECRATAARILHEARQIWTREEECMATLREMLDPGQWQKAHQGVDVAFGLPTLAPSWADEVGDEPCVGINVSGLLYEEQGAARAQYGLAADYAELMQAVLAWILDNTSLRVLLVPHVRTSEAHTECDERASRSLLESLKDRHAGRVRLVPHAFDECEAKWLISRTEFFIGTRMHSTIAALSSGVPCLGMAYSKKMQGVFDMCGLGANVFDLRSGVVEQGLAQVSRAWTERGEARSILQGRMPQVRSQHAQQMDRILEGLMEPVA